MTYLQAMLHRKIHLAIALLAIFIIAAIAAWAISAQGAGGGATVGLQILSNPVKCVPDPPPASMFCNGSCPVCGSIRGLCSGLFEVKARFLSGRTNPLKGGMALCLYNPKPPKGGSFRSGGKCLGVVSGKGPHLLTNFGCSR